MSEKYPGFCSTGHLFTRCFCAGHRVRFAGSIIREALSCPLHSVGGRITDEKERGSVSSTFHTPGGKSEHYIASRRLFNRYFPGLIVVPDLAVCPPVEVYVSACAPSTQGSRV